MPTDLADRIKETSTTTGTSDITLAGAVSQFKTFSSRFVSGTQAVADAIYYAIVGQIGTEWEVGKGYLSGATTLVRVTVFSSSNSDALVNFSAGTKDVFVTIPAARIDETFTKGQSVALNIGLAMP